MTTPDVEATQQTEETVLLYYVSFERLAELKRSAIGMVAVRRPQSCPSRQKPDQELTDPQKVIAEIAEYCEGDEDFIRTEMPIQEIVFRMMLSRRNEPTLLRELHQELTEKWATPIRPISITEQALARILDSDTFYGFARAETS